MIASKSKIDLKFFTPQTINTILAYKQMLLQHVKKLCANDMLPSWVEEYVNQLHLLHCCIDVEQLYNKDFNIEDTIAMYIQYEQDLQNIAMQEFIIRTDYDIFEKCLQQLYAWTNAKIGYHNKLATFLCKIAEVVWTPDIASCPQLAPYNNQSAIVVCDNRIFVNYFSHYTMKIEWPTIYDYEVASIEDSFKGMKLTIENSRRNAMYSAKDDNVFDFRTKDWNIVANTYKFAEKLFNNPSWQQLLCQWRKDTFNLNKLRQTTYLVYRAILRTFVHISCEKSYNHIVYSINHDCQHITPKIVEHLCTENRQHQFDDYTTNLWQITADNYLDKLACFLFASEYTTNHPNLNINSAPLYE